MWRPLDMNATDAGKRWAFLFSPAKKSAKVQNLCGKQLSEGGSQVHPSLTMINIVSPVNCHAAAHSPFPFRDHVAQLASPNQRSAWDGSSERPRSESSRPELSGLDSGNGIPPAPSPKHSTLQHGLSNRRAGGPIHSLFVVRKRIGFATFPLLVWVVQVRAGGLICGA